MVTSADVWWSSDPSSAELSRQAAQRSALSQAVAERRQRRRIRLGQWYRDWRLPSFATARRADG